MTLLCENIDDFGIHIVFLGSFLNTRYPAFLGTPKVGLSDLSAGKKNCLQRLRPCSQSLLRQETPSGSGTFLWGHAHLPGCGSPARVLPNLPYGEAGNLGMAGETPFYTKRFAFYVGRRCRGSTLQDVAKEVHLNWKTVKELEKQYMREQLRRVGTPGPKVIGIDEVSIRKGHDYRIVVSDLVRRRPIWFGGKDRSESSLDRFFAWLGPKKSKRIRLAVMDMWKPFRNSTRRNAPQAAILIGQVSYYASFGGSFGCGTEKGVCPAFG
jgi:hypothetical protein